MKTIIRALSVVALAAALVSCGSPKAEFITASFVSFSGTKYTVKESATEFKVPVNLVSDKTLETTVTYQITGGSAIVGKHYTLPDASGVLHISNDPAKCDSIVICPIDSTGVLTKNKTIEITLGEVTADGIYMGNATKCTVTIIDVDGGISLLVGDWTGTDLATSNKPASFEFSIETTDPTEDYPEANVKIPLGMTVVDAYTNSWTSQRDIYAKFDEDTSELIIFPHQVLDAGNFGDEIGVLNIALDSEAAMRGTSEDPVVLSVNEGVLSFKAVTYFALYDEEGNWPGYTCGSIKANEEIRKND